MQKDTMIQSQNKTKMQTFFMLLFMLFAFLAIKYALSATVIGYFSIGNSAPNLTSNIPNQTWNMNLQKTGLDLDNYYNDSEDAVLTYAYSTSDHPHISVNISALNVVTFTPDNRWNGTEHIMFYANDSEYTISSNNVTLKVLYSSTAPRIITYSPSSSKPNVSELANQTFNISFTDAEDDNITVTWKVNGTSVLQETRILTPSNYLNTSSYTFTNNYSSSGTYVITVVVSDGALTATLPSWTLNVTDVNRPPYFTRNISNLSWNQGSSYTIDSLDNYVYDADLIFGDSLSYSYTAHASVSNITVTINPITHTVTFRPYSYFVGNEQFYFKVTDSKGAYNYSNNLTININRLSAAPSNAGETSTGGKYYTCENYYSCTRWSKCNPRTNIRTRKCVDLAECDIRLNPPPEKENCTYVPTCEDGIKNQDEEGTDCGGPCPACWTCFDGIKNQDEEGIDCGGPCKACATCDDGIRNCHRIDSDTLLCEDDIDCGGPCMECERYSPLVSFLNFMKSIIVPALILMLTIGLGFAAYRIILPKLRKKHEVSGNELCTKELTRIEHELSIIERNFYRFSNKEVLEKISASLNSFIGCKFMIHAPFTQKELIAKILEYKVKGEHIIKEIILKIHSELYDMKFSGNEIDREELLTIVSELKILVALELEKQSPEKKQEKRKLFHLYKLYLEKFYYLKSEETEKMKELDKAIANIEKGMTHADLKKISSLVLLKKVNKISEKIIERNALASCHTKKTVHHHHNLATMAAILIVACVISILLGNYVSNHGGNSRDIISGFVVYDETPLPEEIIPTSNETIPSENTVVEQEPINIDEIPVEQQPETLEKTQSSGDGRVIITAGSAPSFIYPVDGQSLTASEDNFTSWLLQGYDADGESLTFTFLESEVNSKFILQAIPHTIVNYNSTAGWINFTPNETYVWDSNKVLANYSVTLVVKDTAEPQKSSTISVIFNVTNTNDAPTIPTHTPSSLTPSVAENSSLTFTYDNTTADPDQIHPNIERINQTWYLDGILNTTNLSWSYMPGLCDAGTHNVTLNVTDLAGINGTKKWTVNVTNTNRAPINNKTFSGYSYVQWTEDSNVADNITLSQFFNDTDKAECSGSNQDILTYGYEFISISSVNNSARINVSINPTTSNVSFYPAANWYGVEIIRFFANDSHTITYSDYNITLNITNDNDAPILYNISSQNATSNILFTLSLTAFDPDNDTLNFTDNTTLFNISQTTGIINFTPSSDQVGNYSIKINVSDPSGLSSSITFNLTISLGNRAPTIDRIYPYGTPISSTRVSDFANTSLFPGSITSFNTTEDTTIIFNHTSTDLDGNTLNCTWYLDSVLFKNESCTTNSSWTYGINFTQAGIRNITAIINDNGNSTDTTDQFTWNVTVINVNRIVTFGKKNITDYSDFSSGTVNMTNITSQSGNITLDKVDGVSYYTNGTYLSSAINLQASYDKVNITSLTWHETKPSGTNIFIRVKTANTSPNLDSASWSNYSNSTTISIDSSKTSYVQFEANLSTTNTSLTPSLESVVINYEIKQYDTVVGNINSWIDLDHYFNDLDTDDTINYGYEIISGSSVISLSIDSSDNTVDLGATTSGNAVFRFYANDTTTNTYSNNISVTVSIYEAPTTTVTSGGGGGGGSSKPKVKIVKDEVPMYLQLIHISPLEVVEQRELLSPGSSNEGSIIAQNLKIKAPIILNNTADKDLEGVHLSAKTNIEGVSFEFVNPEIESIEANGYVTTELYITQSNSITGAYSVDVIADIDDPSSQDVSTININPMSNLTKKINTVMDMIKINPICRELEEVVIKAQAAIQHKNYKEADTLLEDAISGCKYLIAASQKGEPIVHKKTAVFGSKWLYLSVGLFISLLLVLYIAPKIVNKINSKRFQQNKKYKNKK